MIHKIRLKYKGRAILPDIPLSYFLLVQAAVLMLAFTLFGALYLVIGAVLAGLVTTMIFAGLAFILVKQARKRLDGLK